MRKVVYGFLTEAGHDRLSLPHQGSGLFWYPRGAIYASVEEAMTSLLAGETEVVRCDINEGDVAPTTRRVCLEAGDIRLDVEDGYE
jgi:hypothetical protein